MSTMINHGFKSPDHCNEKLITFQKIVCHCGLVVDKLKFKGLGSVPNKYKKYSSWENQLKVAVLWQSVLYWWQAKVAGKRTIGLAICQVCQDSIKGI